MVRIILLNFNAWQDTVECIESLLKLDYASYQIIVIDNNSPNDSWILLQNWANGNFKIDFDCPENIKNLVYPLTEKPVDYLMIEEHELKNNPITQKILFVKAKENGGFATGNNIILKYLLQQPDFEFAWLLNNDTVVDHEALKNLVQYQKNNPDIGILGSKLLYYNSPDTIQAIGATYNPFLGITKHILAHCKDQIFDYIPKPDYIVGASMFITKEFLQDVGLIAEEFFLYFEDLDFSEKAKKKGWKIDNCLTAVVYHKEGSSIGSHSKGIQKSKLADYYGFVNRIKFTKKNHLYHLPFVYLSCMVVILIRLKRLQFDRAALFLKIFLKSLIQWPQ